MYGSRPSPRPVRRRHSVLLRMSNLLRPAGIRQLEPLILLASQRTGHLVGLRIDRHSGRPWRRVRPTSNGVRRQPQRSWSDTGGATRGPSPLPAEMAARGQIVITRNRIRRSSPVTVRRGNCRADRTRLHDQPSRRLYAAVHPHRSTSQPSAALCGGLSPPRRPVALSHWCAGRFSVDIVGCRARLPGPFRSPTTASVRTYLPAGAFDQVGLSGLYGRYSDATPRPRSSGATSRSATGIGARTRSSVKAVVTRSYSSRVYG